MGIVKSLGCAVLALLVAAGAVSAADEGLKIGYVDIPKALKGSKGGQEAVKQLEGEFKKRRAELEERAKRIKAAADELEAKKAALNELAYKDKVREVEDMQREAKRYQDDARQEMMQREAELTQSQMKRVLRAVRDVGADKDYDLIFHVSNEQLAKASLLEDDPEHPVFDPGAGLLYAAPRFDVTDEVIKRMNASGG